MSAERLRPPESLIGQSTKEVVIYLAQKYTLISSFNFVYYQPRLPNPPSLAERITSGPKDIPLQLTREEVLSGRSASLWGQEKGGFLLAVNSNVDWSGQKAQVPMMDFKNLVGKESEDQIKELMRLIGLSGFLINFGYSYHFIGSKIIFSPRAWEKFLGECLLSNLADQKFIGHALNQGFATLRISAGENYLEPKVVAVL